MVPYSMYKCMKFTLQESYNTCILSIVSRKFGTVTLPVVRSPNTQSVMLCRQCDAEFSVDSGYSSCHTLSLESHIVISAGPAKRTTWKYENGKHFRLPKTEGTFHYTLHGKQ